MYASGKFWCVNEYYTLISENIIYDISVMSYYISVKAPSIAEFVADEDPSKT